MDYNEMIEQQAAKNKADMEEPRSGDREMNKALAERLEEIQQMQRLKGLKQQAQTRDKRAADAKAARQEQDAWRKAERYKRQEVLETARNADIAVARATKAVSTILAEHKDIRKNMERLTRLHKGALADETLAKKRMQLAQGDYEKTRTKEKQARAVLGEANQILSSKELDLAMLDLADAAIRCAQAWHNLPNHIRKDSKKGQDRGIKKAAKEALK